MSKALVTYNEGMMVKVKYEGGGQLPAELTGMYTSHALAGAAIDEYLQSKKRVVPTPKPQQVEQNANSVN